MKAALLGSGWLMAALTATDPGGILVAVGLTGAVGVGAAAGVWLGWYLRGVEPKADRISQGQEEKGEGVKGPFSEGWTTSWRRSP